MYPFLDIYTQISYAQTKYIQNTDDHGRERGGERERGYLFIQNYDAALLTAIENPKEQNPQKYQNANPPKKKRERKQKKKQQLKK